MCGIAGFFDLNQNEDWSASITKMTSLMAHRGPDDEGKLRDAETGVVLGHRRLAIVDLSPEGHQPMASASGRYEITFNGEIYNFRALGEELQRAGCSFRGHSDTEIMPAAFEEWGIQKSVERFVGMFAFAVLDRKARRLFLVRDRLGEKPLYYGWMNDVFMFASELKALQAHTAFRGEINRNALAMFIGHRRGDARRRRIVRLPQSVERHDGDADRRSTDGDRARSLPRALGTGQARG